MQIPEARWIVWGTLLLFVLMIAVYVSFFFRDLAIGNEKSDTTNLLTDFRKMREEGQLDENEYSRLKSRIPDFKNADWSSSESDIDGQETDSEKRFLTLAEAQELKKNASSQDSDEEE